MAKAEYRRITYQSFDRICSDKPNKDWDAYFRLYKEDTEFVSSSILVSKAAYVKSVNYYNICNTLYDKIDIWNRLARIDKIRKLRKTLSKLVKENKISKKKGY